MKVDIQKRLYAVWWQEKKHPAHEGVTGASEGYFGGDGMFVFNNYGRAEEVAGMYKLLHNTKVLTWHLHGTCETCTYSEESTESHSHDCAGCPKCTGKVRYCCCTDVVVPAGWYCADYKEKE